MTSEKKRKLDEDESPTSRRLLMVVEYDGTEFNGFQAQDRTSAKTVQGTIEAAITRLTGENLRLQAASRTDRQVSAKGQIIIIDTATSKSDDEFLRGINTRLPESIAITRITTVSADFNPRHCLNKIYTYRIRHNGRRSPLHRHFCWQLRETLNILAMKQASKHFLQPDLDFTAFTPVAKKKNADVAVNNICTLSSLEILDISPQELQIRLQGNRFLYRMVRILVGTLVAVGQNRLQPEVIPQIIQSKDRSQSSEGAPPHALELTHVNYPPL